MKKQVFKDGKAFVTGKKPRKFDARNLTMSRYLTTLAVPPLATDHANRLPDNIGMMTNDRYGSCTIAAAGHQVQSWSTYAERGMHTIPDEDILRAYLAISPYDNGAYMLDALNYWRKTGIGYDKIEAFVETSPGNLTEAELAIHHFGSHYIGLSLPDENTFGPWTLVTGPPNPYNGHAVCLLAYDRNRKMFKVATWGEIWDMSYDFFRTYMDEGYACLNDISLIQATGKSPEGFDWDALNRDLGHIGDPVIDDPNPPAPVPTPPVDPGHDCAVFNWIKSLWR